MCESRKEGLEDSVCDYPEGCELPAKWYCPGCYGWFCQAHLKTQEIWFVQEETPYECWCELIQVTACSTCLAFAKEHGIFPIDAFLEEFLEEIEE